MSSIEHRIALAERIAGQVLDPEIPVLTIKDLGILRRVRAEGDVIVVEITPTYTSCPAVEVIAQDISQALRTEDLGPFRVNTILAPAWTTDWIGEEGRKKLLEYGIAPPVSVSATNPGRPDLKCPQCGSSDTVKLSQFGSTACKSLWRCNSCSEPFDHFKCH